MQCSSPNRDQIPQTGIRFPKQESNSWPQQWNHVVLTTGLPGKSPCMDSKYSIKDPALEVPCYFWSWNLGTWDNVAVKKSNIAFWSERDATGWESRPPSQKSVPALRSLTEAVLDFPAPEELPGDCHHMSGSREDGQENHPDCQSPRIKRNKRSLFLLLFGGGFLQSNR